jgi:hypothetical protein
VINKALSHIRDGFEAAMRMLRKAGDDLTVIHPPSVDAGKVLTDLTTDKRRGWTEVLVACGIVIEVVNAEQERVNRWPLKAEWHGL